MGRANKIGLVAHLAKNALYLDIKRKIIMQMKISNPQAAFLYLLIFNLGERDYSDQYQALTYEAQQILDTDPDHGGVYVPDEDGWPVGMIWTEGFNPMKWLFDEVEEGMKPEIAELLDRVMDGTITLKDGIAKL